MKIVPLSLLSACLMFSALSMRADSHELGKPPVLVPVPTPGNQQDTAPDAYEDDNVWQRAKEIKLGERQEHNFATDNIDWVFARVKAGEVYRMETDAYKNCDTMINLFCNFKEIAANNKKSVVEKDCPAQGSRLAFKVDQDCQVFLRITPKDGKFGPGLPYSVYFTRRGEKAPQKK